MNKQELCAHLLLLGLVNVAEEPTNEGVSHNFLRYEDVDTKYNIQVMVFHDKNTALIRYDLSRPRSSKWHKEMPNMHYQPAFDFVVEFLTKYPSQPPPLIQES